MSSHIEAVHQDLETWRAQRVAKNAPVPTKLRKRILGLLETHSRVEISKGLKLSGWLLSKWIKEYGIKPPQQQSIRRIGLPVSPKKNSPAQKASLRQNVKATTNFIEIPNPCLGNRVATGPGEVLVELVGTSQSTLRIRGSLDQQSLRTLAEVVVGGPRG